jgi:hypothetical protein
MTATTAAPRRELVLAAAVALTLALPARSAAVSITLTPPGSTFRGVFGPPGSSAIPTSGLFGLVDAAASYWEDIILDDASFVVELGFDSMPLNVFAATVPFGNGGGVMAFNASAALWFVDSTPFDHSEYTELATFTDDLGFGTVNSGIVYSGALGSAAGRFDMLSVALHELGHVLGFFDHLDSQTAVLGPGAVAGQRKLISDTDILAVAAAGGYSNFRLNDSATPVPEPPTALLVLSGLAAAPIARRSHGRRAPQRPSGVR